MKIDLASLPVLTYSLSHGQTLERCRYSDKPDLWAIRSAGDCLNRRGAWEVEPAPSSRSAAFLKRCRFETPEEALAVFERR